MSALNSADIAWMLISTALVLVMTPALGFFYSGMVRRKSTLNTLMMSFAALGFVGLAWALVGYSLAFTPSLGGSHGTIGSLDNALLRGVGLEAHGTIPHLLFMAYQATFAIITAALISGAIVERMRFGPYVAFIALWSVFVYAPIAHWVWASDGWLAKLGTLDFAGGTVVHINAAAAAFVVASVVGARKDFGRQALLPQNIPFMLLGTGLLWLGWFGFNGGSALAANASAALALVNTMFAPMATLVVWAMLDFRRTGKATAIGVGTAIVVGLVAITPAAGFVSPISAIFIGAVSAVPCYFALLFRARTRLDDSLDVVSAHGVGGIMGALLTGVLAQKAWNGATDGALFGNPGQLWTQAIAVVATIVYSMVVTYVILKVMGLVVSLRASTEQEGIGLDVGQHGEEAYSHGEGAILIVGERRGKTR
jgi:Amt family ammonium transporter